jgi:sugar phosphate permease
MTVADVVYRKVQWRLLPVLMVCYVLAFLDRSSISFAKLQFSHDLGFSEAVYGFGAGIFYVGYMSFAVPCNLFLAKKGVRLTLLIIMMAWGLTEAFMAAMRTPMQYYVLRLVLGAAEAGLFPGVLLYLTYWVPASRRGRFTAVFMTAVALSGIIGGLLSAAIMDGFHGLAGLAGWQWLFIVAGLPSCAMGVVAYFYLSDGPAQASWLTETERQVIANELQGDHKGTGRRPHRSFSQALRDPRFYMLACMAYALFASVSGFNFWLPQIVRDSGVASLRSIGLLAAVPWLAGAVAMILAGRFSDRHFEHRRWHTASAALVAAVAWGMLPVAGRHPVSALVVLTLATAATLAAMVPFWTMPAALMSGTAAAAGIALFSLVGSAGSLISPVLVGLVADSTGSLESTHYYYTAVMAAGALAVAFAGPRRAAAPAQSEAGG